MELTTLPMQMTYVEYQFFKRACRVYQNMQSVRDGNGDLRFACTKDSYIYLQYNFQSHLLHVYNLHLELKLTLEVADLDLLTSPHRIFCKRSITGPLGMRKIVKISE